VVAETTLMNTVVGVAWQDVTAGASRARCLVMLT